MSKTIKQIREQLRIDNPWERSKLTPKTLGVSTPSGPGTRPKIKSSSQKSSVASTGPSTRAKVMSNERLRNLTFTRDEIKTGQAASKMKLAQKRLNKPLSALSPKVGVPLKDVGPNGQARAVQDVPRDAKNVGAPEARTFNQPKDVNVKSVATNRTAEVQALKPGETLKDKGPTTSVKATTQDVPAQKTAPAPAAAAKPAAPSSRPAPAAPRQSAPQKSSWGFHGTQTSTMRKGASTQAVTNAALGGVYEEVKPQIKESFEQFLRNTFLKG